jgi:hypothetical protein
MKSLKDIINEVSRIYGPVSKEDLYAAIDFVCTSVKGFNPYREFKRDSVYSILDKYKLWDKLAKEISVDTADEAKRLVSGRMPEVDDHFEEEYC